MSIHWEDAKYLLEEGNKRYLENKLMNKNTSYEKRYDLSTNGQHPFAVILSCSDSRVPVELIFDQGLGDVFVVRNAGNVVDSIVLGSIEYGASHLGAPLIVVLGHTHCGAVKATVDGEKPHGNISAIIKKIKPSFEKVKQTSNNKDELYTKCEDENILNNVEIIKNSSMIKELISLNKVAVIGAKYDITTGKVDFHSKTK